MPLPPVAHGYTRPPLALCGCAAQDSTPLLGKRGLVMSMGVSSRYRGAPFWEDPPKLLPTPQIWCPPPSAGVVGGVFVTPSQTHLPPIRVYSFTISTQWYQCVPDPVCLLLALRPSPPQSPCPLHHKVPRNKHQPPPLHLC